MRRKLLTCVLGALIAVVIRHQAGAQSAIEFKPMVSVPADNSPSAVVAADLNGDSHIDLAVTNSDSNDITLLLGDGTGAFTATSNPLTTDDSPVSLIVADINSDGHPDLVCTNDLADDLSVFLNTGTSSLFGSQITTDTGSCPEAVVSADFNGDNKLDIATADYLDGTVTIQYGNNDGTFQNAISPLVCNGPDGLAVGNVVGNSALDLVVSCADDNVVIVLQGNGDGTFQVPDCTTSPLPATCLQAGNSPAGVVIADVNGDSKLDIVVANEDDDDVVVMLNNGDGTFQLPDCTASPTPALCLQPGLFSFPVAVAVADFDRDGKADIVSVNSGNDNVTVFRGLGSSTFDAGTMFATGGTPVWAAVGDANGDGLPDLFTANSDTNDVSVLLNDSAGGCTGDCDGNGKVTVDELVKGVNIALGLVNLDVCPQFDKNHDGRVTVDELVVAVNNALDGCTE